MIEGVIYKYTSPSGKVYIGQTTNEKKRRNCFLNKDKDYAGEKINRARKKYGVNNFEYEVIFKVSSLIKSEVKEILNEKEIQYIKLFDSFNNGYNSDMGGGGGTYTRNEENKKLMSEITKEYYKSHKSSVAKPVIQYSIFGDYINEWESAKQAGEALNLQPNGITTVCKRHRNKCGDFIWRYKSDFKDEIPMHIDIKIKNTEVPVIQYSLEGVEIKRWKNLTIAAQELGYSLGNFSTYCNGRNNHEYKGFLYYRGERI